MGDARDLGGLGPGVAQSLIHGVGGGLKQLLHGQTGDQVAGVADAEGATALWRFSITRLARSSGLLATRMMRADRAGSVSMMRPSPATSMSASVAASLTFSATSGRVGRIS